MIWDLIVATIVAIMFYFGCPEMSGTDLCLIGLGVFLAFTWLGKFCSAIFPPKKSQTNNTEDD